jgi:hypothetical protein
MGEAAIDVAQWALVIGVVCIIAAAWIEANRG